MSPGANDNRCCHWSPRTVIPVRNPGKVRNSVDLTLAEVSHSEYFHRYIDSCDALGHLRTSTRSFDSVSIDTGGPHCNLHNTGSGHSVGARSNSAHAHPPPP